MIRNTEPDKKSIFEKNKINRNYNYFVINLITLWGMNERIK